MNHNHNNNYNKFIITSNTLSHLSHMHTMFNSHQVIKSSFKEIKSATAHIHHSSYKTFNYLHNAQNGTKKRLTNQKIRHFKVLEKFTLSKVRSAKQGRSESFRPPLNEPLETSNRSKLHWELRS